MKTLFKVLVLGILMTAFAALTFAQDGPTLADLFDKFKIERKAACGERDAALATGKLIIEKFGDDELNKDIIDYVKKQVAIIEKDDLPCKRFNRYNKDYKDKNWSDFFAVSKEIMSIEGDSTLGFDVLITLTSVGYERTALDKLDTYNNETINNAKSVLQKIEAGKTSKSYGTWVPFNSKENTQSWMNYILGFYTLRAAANDPSKKKDALAYFYKSTQVGNDNKNDVSIYTQIGDYYFSEAAKLDEKYRGIRAANNNTDNDESKAVLGMARGYADRGIDAFARARKISIDNKAKQTQIDAISKTLSDLYKFRFNIAPDAKTPDLEMYVSGLLTKLMPDPATDVTPVLP